MSPNVELPLRWSYHVTSTRPLAPDIATAGHGERPAREICELSGTRTSSIRTGELVHVAPSFVVESANTWYTGEVPQEETQPTAVMTALVPYPAAISPLMRIGFVPEGFAGLL